MWIVKKIENQVKKLQNKMASSKVKSYLKTLKSYGNNCFIQFPVRFEGSEFISLGNNVSINAFVHIWGQGGVTIGNDTLIASHVAIVTVTHDTAARKYCDTIIEKPIKIGNNVWLGSHCVILPGITIGDNVIVGAGSVVTKDLEKNGVYVGSPAKWIRGLSQFTNDNP